MTSGRACATKSCFIFGGSFSGAGTHLSGAFHMQIDEGLAVALGQALDFLDLLEVRQKDGLRKRAAFTEVVRSISKMGSSGNPRAK